MNLPYSDPSNPALVSPLFNDLTAVRSDLMRANNAAIFANFEFISDFLSDYFTDADQITIDEILEKTTDAGVTIDGVLCKDGVVTGDLVGDVTGDVTGDLTGNADTATEASGIVETGSGGIIKCKVLEIGAWDMDTSSVLNIAHGLSLSSIRSVDAMIIGDAQTGYESLQGATVDGDLKGHIYYDATNISLQRTTGGYFDAVQFHLTSFSRGWITILYIS